MARTRTPKPWHFIGLLVLVYAILLFMARKAFQVGGWWIDVGYPAGSWGCMGILAIVSIWLRVRQEVRLGTAAINVQAMGIFALVLGLGISVNTFGQGVTDMRRLGNTLGEALLSAAIGIALAVILKTLEDQFFGNGKSAPAGTATAAATMAAVGIDPGAITAAFEALRRELASAQPEARALHMELQKARVLTEEWGKLLEKLRRFFPAAGGGTGGV
ncbi:MAG: hypothetical protein Q7N87_00025 [Candidatus Uhrbacteria bacterium]|nr:hypothetical protein [Candidatus Uhrbacteria bacterium]